MILRLLTALMTALTLSACGAPPPTDWKPDVGGLSQEVRQLSPAIDPEEATRLAQISFSYSQQLAREYNVTDPPLVHNAKVNRGTRPRGLCWHWADDLEKRLRQENFQSVQFHRAIANTDNVRVEHSTVIVSAPGAAMEDGVVLDPWRYGGKLFWAPVVEDTRYRWIPRQQVFAEKKRRAAQEEAVTRSRN